MTGRSFLHEQGVANRELFTDTTWNDSHAFSNPTAPLVVPTFFQQLSHKLDGRVLILSQLGILSPLSVDFITVTPQDQTTQKIHVLTFDLLEAHQGRTKWPKNCGQRVMNKTIHKFPQQIVNSRCACFASREAGDKPPTQTNDSQFWFGQFVKCDLVALVFTRFPSLSPPRTSVSAFTASSWILMSACLRVAILSRHCFNSSQTIAATSLLSVEHAL